jgi:hypothetical protein
VSQQQ